MRELSIKLSYLLVTAVVLALFFHAQFGYSDSFVDETAKTTLNNFRFGHSDRSVNEADYKTADCDTPAMKNGDSFVDPSVVTALTGFRFGHSDIAANTKRLHLTESDTTAINKGDSFVDASVIGALEEFKFSIPFRVMSGRKISSVEESDL